ncbi:cornichon [Neoconidiobolus thromboides FSU 785]|nr:cornichon [Neoconidiobolus thromboides FSU 785]
MNGSVVCFLLCLILAVVLILFSIFFLIMLTDLESDYINPVDLCNKLNKYIMPEHITHGLIVIILLFSGMYYSLLFNLPLFLFNLSNIYQKKLHLDATEIFRSLPKHKWDWGFRLGFYLLCLFWYLYRMIVCLVEQVRPTTATFE